MLRLAAAQAAARRRASSAQGGQAAPTLTERDVDDLLSPLD